MKARITTQVTIAASKKAVFGYLSDLQYHHLWNPQLESVTPLGKLKANMAYESTAIVVGVRLVLQNIVTKLVANQELEIENSTGLLHYSVNYHLSSKNRATLVTCSIAVSTESKAFAFTKPALEMLARRELQSDLQALKIAVEQKLR